MKLLVSILCYYVLLSIQGVKLEEAPIAKPKTLTFSLLLPLYMNYKNKYEELLIVNDNLEQNLTNIVAENQRLKSDCTELLNQAIDKYSREIAALKENYEYQLNQTAESDQEKIDACENKYEELLIEKQDLKNEVAEIERLKTNCTEELSHASDKHAMEIITLQEEYENQLNQTEESCEMKINACDEERAQSNMLQDELNQLLSSYEMLKQQRENSA